MYVLSVFLATKNVQAVIYIITVILEPAVKLEINGIVLVYS
jgi:hypothetical protein